ncbi:hypothetical protein VTN00DRAFT_5054 [Thermoascus crustaceus]|uniref:uncharacterized protein n=1 Tax=Thermoascus crustaceus TaxID=5088 RepID=UPI003743EC00
MDDVLLLGMAQINDDGLSPNSKKVIEKNTASFTAAARVDTSRTTLSIQRPPSSGIDIAGFNYSRPARHSTQFSFRPPREKSSVDPSQKNDSKERRDSGVCLTSTDADPTLSITSNPANRPTSPEAPTETAQDYSKLHIRSDTDREILRSETTEVITDNSHPRNSIPKEHHHTEKDGRNATDGQKLPKEHDKPRYTVTADRDTPAENNIQHSLTDNGTTQPICPSNPSTAPNWHVLGPSNQQTKVSKRHNKQKTKATKPGPSTPVPTFNSSPQPSEEELFYLIIHRLRQREENEAAASAIHEQLKTEILGLNEENQSLRAQLEESDIRQRKQESELSSHRGQVEYWRTKLAKLKRFLNGLGKDYENLRSEARNLKSTQISLSEEKGELIKCIQDMKSNVDQVASKISKHPGQLTEMSKTIQSLIESLRSAEEKTEAHRKRLLEEQEQVSTLQDYIQNSSKKQDKKLNLIRNKQSEVLSKLSLAIDHVNKQWQSSHTNLQSVLGPAVNESSQLIKALHDKELVEKTDLERIKESIGAVTAGVQSFAMQMSKDAEKDSNIQNDIGMKLSEQLEKIEAALGSNMNLSEQLTQAYEKHGRLEENLKTAESTIASLTTTVEDLKLQETNLKQRVTELEADLSEAQKRQEVSTGINTSHKDSEAPELRIQLEATSAALKEAEERLRIKDSEIECVNQSLLEAKNMVQETERHVEEIASEKNALAEEIRGVELKVREELSRASLISRDQNRAQFEQQLHKIKREKAIVEKESAKMKEQLDALQASLLASKDERIRSLEDTQIEHSATMAAKEEEVRKYKDLERSHASELTTLQSHLNEANAEINNLRETISSKKCNSENPKELLQKIDLLETDLSKKEEEITSLHSELDSSKSERLALESDKERAKMGIHTLLQKVQDSERWIKRAEETLRRLEILNQKETLPEVWNFIEERLRDRLHNLPPGSLHCRNNVTQESSKSSKNNFTKAKNERQNLNTIMGSRAEGFVRTTEFIYRTHDARTETPAFSKHFPRSQSESSTKLPGSLPEKQLSSSIVPFSQVQNTFIPQAPFSPAGDLSELGNMLPLTPQQGKSADKEDNRPIGETKSDQQRSTHTVANKAAPPSAQNKGRLDLDHRSGTISVNDAESEKNQDTGQTSESYMQRPEQITYLGLKRKATARETQNSLTSVESDAKLDSQITSQADIITASTSPKKGTSNINQQPDAKGPLKGILKDPTTRNSLPKGVTTKTSTNSSQNKRVKQSPKQTGTFSRQTHSSSEYFGNSGSPASSIASGSRRSNGHAGFQRHPVITRSHGRGRRRSRGERYNDRFSQEIPASQ